MKNKKESEKVRENRLRRMAARQDLILKKSKRRDPQAIDYGCYMLVNAHNGVVAGANPGWADFNLDDVEKYCSAPHQAVGTGAV